MFFLIPCFLNMLRKNEINVFDDENHLPPPLFIQMQPAFSDNLYYTKKLTPHP